MDTVALTRRLGAGLMAFPVTPFRTDLSLDIDRYADHASWLAGFDPSAQVAASGAGEFHALGLDEIAALVRATRDAAPGTPLVSGCGLGTGAAIAIARAAEAAGADALLLMPPYLVEAPQAGLAAHVRAVAGATGLPLILYNRANARFTADTVARLAEDCPGLIGFKDGTGDILLVRELSVRLGDRLMLLGGMPTHEVYAEAFRGAGATAYSSAVFNFAPRLALSFHDAVARGDRVATDAMLAGFFLPFARLRARQPGYAVSIIKAAMRLTGRDCGPVRPPLSDLSAEEEAMLRPLLEEYAR